MSKTFLKASWRKLVMANFSVEAGILEKYVPYRTELDYWNGQCYLSLVGFMFLDTRVLGIKIPWHINFEEVNLRFYVRYNDGKEWKRGVVFIKEIVPRKAITFIANSLYKENYVCYPMKHSWEANDKFQKIKYQWKAGDNWQYMAVKAALKGEFANPGSVEAFITEHYWGYTKVGDRKTSEYQVVHPSWKLHQVLDCDIQWDPSKLYGEAFGFLQQLAPDSVFLAEGSPIEVKRGNALY